MNDKLKPAECEPVAWTTRQQIERLKNPAYDGTIPMAMWKAKVYERVTIPLYTTPQPCPDCLKWATDMSQVTKTLRYIIGIAERGTATTLPDGVTVESFVLDYVKGLEAKVAELTKESEYYRVNRDIAGKAYLGKLTQRNEYAEKLTRVEAVIEKCETALNNSGQGYPADDMDDGTYCDPELVKEALAAIKEIEK